MAEIVKNVSMAELKNKGDASKQRASEVFSTSRWIEEILS